MGFLMLSVLMLKSLGHNLHCKIAFALDRTCLISLFCCLNWNSKQFCEHYSASECQNRQVYDFWALLYGSLHVCLFFWKLNALISTASVFCLYRVDKKRDKIERKILDSQERAFWDVHRPVVSECVCKSRQVHVRTMQLFSFPLQNYSLLFSSVWSCSLTEEWHNRVKAPLGWWNNL